MLRLEACLAGEAANTIKGLGYSLEAQKAAKARLFRKYGESRRQIQSHLEELKKAPADPGQQCQRTGNLRRCLGKSCHHFKGKQPEFRPRTGSTPHNNP